MWFRKKKRSFSKPAILAVYRSTDDQFDLRLQRWVIARQHFTHFSV